MIRTQQNTYVAYPALFIAEATEALASAEAEVADRAATEERELREENP